VLSTLVTCWLCHWCPAPCLAAPESHRQQVTVASPEPLPTPKAEPGPPTPPPPPVPRPQLPDAVVVSAVDVARPAFAACVRRARTRDPNLGAVKIDLHLEIDPTGAVTGATLVLDDALLQRCILSVARGLTFPAPGRPAAAGIAFIAS